MPQGAAVSPELSDRTFRLAALAIVAVYVFAAWLQSSPAYFGSVHDDTLYFATAKALANGEGNVLPNLPGTPDQTKYPPLYPWILSLAWLIQPKFPENLAWAWRINVVLGIWTILAAIGVLRSLGCSRRAALALGTLFALNPYTIMWTNLLISDVLFAALAFSAVLLGDAAFRSRDGRFWPLWVAAVLMAGLSLYARTLGVAAVAGLALYALSKRRIAASALASLAAVPAAWKVLETAGAGGTRLTIETVNGFQQNWLYYTNYIDFWKLCVPTMDAFWAQFNFIGLEALKYPAVAALWLPAEGFASMPMQAFAVAASVAVLHGVYLQAKRKGWSSMHCVALCYLPPILLWNFVLMSRFMFLLLPLLLVGAVVELQRLSESIIKVFRTRQPLDQRIAAGLMGAVLAGVAANGAYRYAIEGPHAFRSWREARERSLPAKQEAYAWLASQGQSGRVVSYEDGLLYLYAGAQAMRPIMPSTEAFFRQDQSVLDRDIQRLGDTAEEIGARYWMTATDDFELETAPEQLREGENKFLADAPVAFESQDGSVQIYELEGALASQRN